MKQLKSLLALSLMLIFAASCATSNQVNNGHFFQKRKYTKGFHHGNLGSNHSKSDSKSESKDEDALESGKNNWGNKSAEKQLNDKASSEETQAQTPAVTKDEQTIPVAVPAQAVPTTEVKSIKRTESTSVVESGSLQTRSEVKQTRNEKLQKMAEKRLGKKPVDTSDTFVLVLLVICSLILPPLAVLLVDGASKRFWIDLVLWLIGIGLGVGVSPLGWLCFLAAVIYAILIVLGR